MSRISIFAFTGAALLVSASAGIAQEFKGGWDDETKGSPVQERLQSAPYAAPRSVRHGLSVSPLYQWAEQQIMYDRATEQL